MKIGNIFNEDRVQALNCGVNAYNKVYGSDKQKTKTQSVEKVLFPQGYENASHYYDKNNFERDRCCDIIDNERGKKDCKEGSSCNCDKKHNGGMNGNLPMFNIQSLLPMLMSGKFNDMIKPLMGLLGGNKTGAGSFDIAKIFEMFKPKLSVEKKVVEEDISSKFDDFVIIED